MFESIENNLNSKAEVLGPGVKYTPKENGDEWKDAKEGHYCNEQVGQCDKMRLEAVCFKKKIQQKALQA